MALQLLNPASRQKMVVRTITWLKDSYNLFDYEPTKNITNQQFIISLEPSFVFLYRNNAKSEIMFVKQSKMQPKNVEGAQLLGCVEIVAAQDRKFKLLFREPSQLNIVKHKNDRVCTEVSNHSADDKQQNIFFIVRSFKDNEKESQGFPLRTGQKIKFGRIEFNVTICKNNQPGEECPNFFSYEETFEADSSKIYSQEDQCKICLSSEQSEDRYFFCQPCDCTGSCSLVHFECLFLWCKTKVKKSKVGKITHYNFDKFECEICKKYFPRFVIYKGMKYDLLPIDKPTGAFLVFSSQGQDDLMEKSMIMINYAQKQLLKLGRNQVCDIRIFDISVSRQHAMIDMRNGEFYVLDNKSKFGTIVHEPNFALEVEKIKRGIQIGRSVAIFQLQDENGQKKY